MPGQPGNGHREDAVTKIVIPSVWAKNGQTEFDGIAGSLPEVLKRFAADNPELRRRVLGADGEPVSYINVCIGDQIVPRDQRAAAVVEAGSVVTIISPMAGG
jgi:sulfur-carrier protein